MHLVSFFPVLENFRSRTRADWRKDLVASITVAVMLVPQGMAYAMLAGVPPIYGLYGGLVPLFLYGIFGTSRQMSIGPVAISALLVLAGVSQIAEPDTSQYIGLVILVALLVGLLQLILSLFRLGFLVNFISHPVIVGFTSAAAIIIAVSQLKDLLGIPIPRFAHAYETFMYAVQHVGEANIISTAFCVGSIIAIALLRKINSNIPGALVVLVVGTYIVYLMGAESMGLEIVRTVPKGLPAFVIPEIDLVTIRSLMPTVLTVAIIGIVESISIAKVIQSKHWDYKIRPNQELFALGLSKIGGALFQAIPTSGSFTRSAVNDDNGAQSGFSSIFTALIIGLTLVFLTPLFFYLPKAVLAAIILLAVKSLFDWKQIKHLWASDRIDFYMLITTFVVTLVLGIEEGVLTGVVLSILMVLYQSSKPHIAVLGKLPHSESYRNIDRFDSVEQPEDVLVIRFDNQLYFGNASYFLDTVVDLAKEKGSLLKLIVIDASSIHQIDSSGFLALGEMIEYFKKQKIKLYFSGLIGPVRDKIAKAGFQDIIGTENRFLRVHDAISHHQNPDKFNR